MPKSKIPWTQWVLNVTTGCTKISPGCRNCYAEKQCNWLCGMGNIKYRNGFNLTLHPEELGTPFKWKKPRMVFVNSMSDLFHDDVPDDFIIEVFAMMSKCSRHIFQVLTKRPYRLLNHRLTEKLIWTRNIWFGVTIESLETAVRALYFGHPIIRARGPKTRFISFEPLIDDIFKETRHPEALRRQNSLLLMLRDRVDWAIVGGESGTKAVRAMPAAWAENIRLQCERFDVPFFFKQMGGHRRDKGGDLLLDRRYKGMPWDRETWLKQNAALTDIDRFKLEYGQEFKNYG